MRLVDDWKWIIRKGWQWRLNIVAAVLSALEVWFSLVNPYTLPEWIPPGAFAAMATIVTLFANLFRLVAQVRPPKKEDTDNADQ